MYYIIRHRSGQSAAAFSSRASKITPLLASTSRDRNLSTSRSSSSSSAVAARTQYTYIIILSAAAYRARPSAQFIWRLAAARRSAVADSYTTRKKLQKKKTCGRDCVQYNILYILWIRGGGGGSRFATANLMLNHTRRSRATHLTLSSCQSPPPETYYTYCIQMCARVRTTDDNGVGARGEGTLFSSPLSAAASAAARTDVRAATTTMYSRTRHCAGDGPSRTYMKRGAVAPCVARHRPVGRPVFNYSAAVCLAGGEQTALFVYVYKLRAATWFPPRDVIARMLQRMKGPGRMGCYGQTWFTTPDEREK